MKEETTTPPWRLVPRERLKDGWTELRGMTPIHHNFIVLGQNKNGDYIVRNPELIMLERKLPGHD